MAHLIHCIECKAVIQPETEARTNGRCMPCFKRLLGLPVWGSSGAEGGVADSAANIIWIAEAGDFLPLLMAMCVVNEDGFDKGMADSILARLRRDEDRRMIYYNFHVAAQGKADYGRIEIPFDEPPPRAVRITLPRFFIRLLNDCGEFGLNEFHPPDFAD